MDNTNPTQAQLATRVQDSGQTPSTITPESLQLATPIKLPQQDLSFNSSSSNTSIPNPTIPTAESIINTNANPTPAETQQTGFLNKIASLISGNKTQTTLQNDEETKAGLPALTTTLNDLNTQLEGLNNQATALQNESQYTIPNKNENASIGVTGTTGLNAMNARDLRLNQIKQGAIATQALTLKSAIYGAQGKYNIAKDAADKAATAQFEQQQQEIDYQKAQLDAIMPTLNKEEKAQAEIQQSKLADRQTAINNGIEDKKTIIALATATLKNYPDDSAAHYAAQQALAESNKDKPDLATVLNLVGKYQTDPVATQKAIADLALTRSQTNKNNADAVKLASDLKIQQASNVDIPSVIGNISNPNETRSELGGLTLNGLTQKAKIYMTNGGNIQGLGLSNSGNSGVQRTLIANYGAYLADKAGLDIPQMTALYKSNSKAATDVIGRLAKIDTTSSTLTGQFPRLAQLATSVGNLGITESDLTAGKAAVARKFGSVDAGNYSELIQTIRSDYAAMQAAVGGSKGGQFFAQNAQEAIPLGLTAEQYMGLADTIKQSADIASQSSGAEVQKLIGGTNTNNTPSLIPTTQVPSGYYQANDGLLYKK